MWVGKMVNRYQIVSLLGEGGMGEVYRAHDPLLQREVAIKMMHSHFVDQPEFRERFLREARAAARMDHPGIVKVFDSGEVNGALYIVMEFIPGPNLRKVLTDLNAQQKRIVLSEAVEIVHQICLALDYAHRQGVLHRDIKPDNIMLKPEPLEGMPTHVVMTDLGLAKLLEGLPITQEGEAMGTPGYMSPEQALGLTMDARSDVYSLGILLFELAAGRLPFPARTLSEAIRYHTKEPPPMPRSLQPGIPAALENVILKTLEKSPEDRYQKASDLAQALKAAQQPVTLVDKAPEMQDVVSLLTQVQVSPLDERGRSILADFPKPAAVPQDRITIMSPDQTTRSVQFPPHGVLTIGRGEENSLAVNDSKVSREHARIEFDGSGYKVVDLKSTNGTFLGDTRLLPGIAENWKVDQPVRVGDTWLRLERAIADGSGAVALPAKPAPERVAAAPAAAGGVSIGVSAPEKHFKVEAGSSVEMCFDLLNQGQLVDHLRASLGGLPPEWVASQPPELHLMPGEHLGVRFSIQPPRSPKSKAGDYPLVLKVASIDHTTQAVDTPLTLTVLPYYQFSLDPRPRKACGLLEGSFTIQVTNQGNSEITVLNEGRDPEDACSYIFTPPQLTLQAGAEGQVQLRVQTRQPVANEQIKIYSINLTARASQAQGLTQQAGVEWERSAVAYELALHPGRQRGAAKGVYNLQISNRCNANLVFQLEASDPEAACQYSFGEQAPAIGPGLEKIVTVTVRPKAPLRGETARTHYFTVTSRVSGAAGASRQVLGEWEQIPPAYELQLAAVQQHGGTTGEFRLTLKNQSDLPLTVQLSAVDPAKECRFTLEPASLRLLEGGEASALLKIHSSTRLQKDEQRAYTFTVTAQPSEAPAILRQVQGEWTQVGGGAWDSISGAGLSCAARPFAWLLLVLGWTFASLFTELTLGIWGGQPGIADWLMGNFGLMDLAAVLIAWGIFGLVYGALIGLVTILALRLGDAGLPLNWLPSMVLGWAFAWGISLPGIIEGWNFGLEPRVFSLVAGLIGGLVTAGVCRAAKPQPGMGLAFLIILAWPFGQLVVWFLLMKGMNMGDFYNATRIDLTSTISSAIAGGVTLFLLALPRGK